jgi:hypothetical protein
VRVNLEIEGGGGTGTWENFIAIENTSGAWTAFHLRFRAWKKSIEVWDHVILLSPFDVFWMTLAKDDELGVALYSADTETLLNSALIYSPATDWNSALSGRLLEKNGFCQDEADDDAKKLCLFNEMRTGYIEAIGMFQLEIPHEACPNLPPLPTPPALPRPEDICTEDTHYLSNVVINLNPLGGSAINVLDVLDALFYAYYPTKNITPPGNLTAQYPIGVLPFSSPSNLEVWAAWPYYNSISIGQHAADADLIPQSVETPLYPRYGRDCGNVLAGVVFMTDEDTGRLQMENFIAVRDFRTTSQFDLTQPYYTYSQTPPAPLNGNADNVQIAGGLEWTHRDGYHGGIFYPASVLKWFYGFQINEGEDIDRDWVFAGGNPGTFLWPYVGESWASVAGPSLRDGDHFVASGQNWNDNFANPYWLPVTGLPRNFYGYTRPLGALGPPPVILSQPGYFVHYLNDIWSLDDLELALQKADIWYTHWTTRFGEDKALITTNTDVVLTYPTKHFHWFFADWPIMWYWSQAPLNDTTGPGAWRTLMANFNDYRGNLIKEDWNDSPLAGYKDVEEYDPTGQEADDDAVQTRVPPFNQTGMTLADWFGDRVTYSNGPIYAEALVYDMDQRLASNGDGTPPPPSPWPPSPTASTVPHEVNIIRVGSDTDHTGIGLGQAYELLELAGKYDPSVVPGIDYPFRKGHFRISMSELRNGQRGYGVWDAGYPDANIYATVDGDYWLPPIGVVIQGNESSGQACNTIRSGMAEWHYLEFNQ